MNRNQIENVLIKMGIPASINGFRYITDALLLLDSEENRNIKYTYLYYMISRRNESTPARVERSIRHAFDLARNCKTDFDTVDHYIGFVNCSNSASLQMLYMRISEEINETAAKEEQSEKSIGEATAKAKEETPAAKEESEPQLLGITETQLRLLIKEMLKETIKELITETA